MFMVAVKKLRNPKCIKRNVFEQALLVKYSKSYSQISTQHGWGAIHNRATHVYGAKVQFERFPDRQPLCPGQF